MPRVRIETAAPMERDTSLSLIHHVMNAIGEVLSLVPDDRTVSFTAYEPEFFRMKPPYKLFIEISLFSGRSKATKKKLYRTIVDRLYHEHGIDVNSVMILLNEQPRENWGLRGGIPGDEISFDYQINL